MVPHPSLNQTNQTNQINPTNPINGLQWYAIRTRARHEKQVRDRLESQGIEQLLPTVIKLSQWKDRKKKIEVPLFSGDCFAHFLWQERLLVMQVPGVAQIVGGGPRPEPIPERKLTPSGRS